MSVDTYLALVAAALVAAIGMLVFAWHLSTQARTGVLGLAVLLVLAVLTPFEVGGGTINGSVLLAAFLCTTWLLRLLLVRRHVALDGSRVVVAVLTFMGIAILSFVAGQYPWFPTDPAPMRAQVGGLSLFLLSGGLFLFVGHHVASLVELRRLTWLFIGVGAVALVTSVVSGGDFGFGPIAVTNSRTMGSLFWTWLVAITFSQGLCNRNLSAPGRLAVLAVGVLTLARGLLLAFSWASGWLPPLVALGVIMLVRFPRFSIGGVLLLAAPALVLASRGFERIMAEESYSWMSRLEALRVMWRLIQHNPWLGFGPANYYEYTLLFPVLGWWVRFNSHNNYIDLVAQTGVLGLLAFCWFIVEVLLLTLRLRSGIPDGFARAYVVGALGGLIGTLVSGLLADWIIPFAYNVGMSGFRSSLLFWFFLGGLLSLARMLQSSPVLAEAPARPGSRHLVSARG